MALTSNWLRPRRRSTSYAHVPSDVAVTWYGCCWPGVTIETVAPGRVVPSSVYLVVDSSTSMTAVVGWVTAIVGGFAKRRTWTPR